MSGCNINTIESASDEYILAFKTIFLLDAAVPSLEFIIGSIDIAFGACFSIHEFDESEFRDLIFLFIFKDDADEIVFATYDAEYLFKYYG